MLHPDPSSAHRVTAGEQAAALDHALRSRLLLACARTDRSLTELARELGQPLPKLHYHVGRLVEAGLLRVSRVEPRSGRSIRRYRAIAEAFLVSLADVPEPVGERWARELRQSLAEQTRRLDLSLLYHLDEAGGIRVRLLDPEGRGRISQAWEHWKVIRLTQEQRMALAGEVAAVIARYEAAGEPSGELFFVHAAFAPKLWNV
jgi:DNA-binding transcriptional ArsR family regulator